MTARLKRGKPVIVGEVSHSDSNIIRLSRTARVEVAPEALARQGIITPANGGGTAIHSAYNALRSQVAEFAARRKLGCLLITSPTAGAGTTVTSINLALQIARHMNRTALLLDFNLRRPAIHHYFGYTPKYGIAECIRREVAFERILFSPLERLTVAPALRAESNATDLLLSPEVSTLLKEVASRYQERLVILDTPPVLEWDDAVTLLPEVDATLLVVKAGSSQASEVRHAMGCLRNTPSVGVVLNGAGKWR